MDLLTTSCSVSLSTILTQTPAIIFSTTPVQIGLQKSMEVVKQRVKTFYLKCFHCWTVPYAKNQINLNWIRTVGAWTGDTSLLTSNGLVDFDECGNICMDCKNREISTVSNGSGHYMSKKYKQNKVHFCKIPLQDYIAYWTHIHGEDQFASLDMVQKMDKLEQINPVDKLQYWL